MTTVTTTNDIAAPPALVRSLFLDFPSIPQWHTGHFNSITVLESAAFGLGAVPAASAPIGEKLVAGDKLRIALGGGMSFKANVVENTAQRFVWRDELSHVMIGEHSFQFNASSSTPGNTTLIHAETFTGGLVTLFLPLLKDDKAKTSPGFEKFNADLKKWAEERSREKGMSE